MTEIYIIGWFLCGILDAHLSQLISIAHAGEPPMGKWEPCNVWGCVLAGPVALGVTLFIAVGYALGWDKKAKHD